MLDPVPPLCTRCKLGLPKRLALLGAELGVWQWRKLWSKPLDAHLQGGQNNQ